MTQLTTHRADQIHPDLTPRHTSSSIYALVIPVYNEAETIREVVKRALSYVPDVIVVDDGSTDEIAKALDSLPITVLRNSENMGKAYSLWRGFQHALGRGARAIISLDGDGQHSPEDLPRMLAQWEENPQHLIIGARKRPPTQAFTFRVWANRLADFWISWAAGYYIADSQSGYRVYPSRLIRQTACRHGKAQSFVFESEVLIESAKLGYRSLPLLIESETRKAGSASHFRPAMDVIRITRMVAWKLLSRGMYPTGLYRSLRERVTKQQKDQPFLPQVTSSNRNPHSTQ